MPPGSMPGGPPMPGMDPFYASPFSSFHRRPAPFMGTPDYRIYEMNKRLQQRPEVVSEIIFVCVQKLRFSQYLLSNKFFFSLLYSKTKEHKIYW